MPGLAQTPTLPELTGSWQDDRGRVFKIQDDGSTVTSTRVEPLICKRTPGQTKDDFVGTRSGLTITGQIKVCRWGQQPEGVVDISFEATIDPRGEQITGTYHDPVTKDKGTFKLTRCKPDLNKACRLLAETANKARNLAEAPPLEELKNDLTRDIARIRVATCDSRDNERVRKELNTAIENVEKADPTEKLPSVKYEPIQKAEDALRKASKLLGCSAPTSTPSLCPKGTPSGPMFDFLKEAGKKIAWHEEKFYENIEALKSNPHFACTTNLIEIKRKTCERTNDVATCLNFCKAFSDWQIGLANALDQEERTRAITMGNDCKGIFLK